MSMKLERERRLSLPWEHRLLLRCQKLAEQGRLGFAGDGTIYYRRREFKGRVGSVFFRAAVEAITRHQSRIVSISVTRKGKPYDVRLSCFNCERDARRWSWRHVPETTRFDLESWPFDGDTGHAYGHCSGCGMAVSLLRDPIGRWSARISRKPEPEY